MFIDVITLMLFRLCFIDVLIHLKSFLIPLLSNWYSIIPHIFYEIIHELCHHEHWNMFLYVLL